MSTIRGLVHNSNFSYSVLNGVTDSAAAITVLGSNGFVSFNVELIDDGTGKIIGSYDNLQFDSKNIYKLISQSYNVNTNGIGNKTVRLALIAESNINSKITMIDSYAEGSIVGKASLKQISYQGSAEIKNYALEQNYPNPFNPSTIIHYEIPNDGLVTLKIYDELGREVKTLVNQFQNIGKYDVNFDASQLASGIYFYQLRSLTPSGKDYISTKKMLLLK